MIDRRVFSCNSFLVYQEPAPDCKLHTQNRKTFTAHFFLRRFCIIISVHKPIKFSALFQGFLQVKIILLIILFAVLWLALLVFLVRAMRRNHRPPLSRAATVPPGAKAAACATAGAVKLPRLRRPAFLPVWKAPSTLRRTPPCPAAKRAFLPLAS